MHTKLEKSPLSYVLAQIRFPSIESMEKYIPLIQEEIRGQLPYIEESSLNNITVTPQGMENKIEKSWNFIDKEKTNAILINKNSISFQTSDYQSSEELFENFKSALIKINNIIKISLVARIGLRYINCIVDGIELVDPKLFSNYR